MVFGRRFARPTDLMRWVASGCPLLLPVAALAAGHADVGAAIPGPTPFIAEISATLSGAPLASVTYAILSKPNSLVAPLAASYSAAYLSSHGDVAGSNVTVPVWGLYAGSNNIVALLYSFADGSNAFALKPVTTAAYLDPCAPINAPTLRQNRTKVSDLGFDYFLLKDFCSSNSPAIVDTDGHLRWVGTAGAGAIAAIFYDNAIYASDGKTGINRIDLTGQTTRLVDYAANGVTTTDHHNMDPGRNGIVVDVNTTAETEGVAVEFNPANGAILQAWDLGHIIGSAMAADGDDPNDFVEPVGVDWFHMNASTYNPADNTEIFSSRENFVIAVDYDTPAVGVRKIHWILGDTTKKWHSFPSLAKYTLQLGPNTLPPIGQHAVSIDLSGNLMLFDDGTASTFQVPAGINRGFSAGRSYKIDTKAMTATEIINYTPQPAIYAPFCGSFYQASRNSYLIDFTTANNETTAELQGLGTNNKVVFDLQYPESQTCGAAFNAVPLPDKPIIFE